jgi:DNA-binding CsgD family transcriptional regulator
LFPPLDLKLTAFLKQHLFLVKIRGLSSEKRVKALLTEKELHIVELLLQGYTYRAIAESLFISENTLKYHTKNIYRRLKVKNRMELVKLFAP